MNPNVIVLLGIGFVIGLNVGLFVRYLCDDLKPITRRIPVIGMPKYENPPPPPIERPVVPVCFQFCGNTVVSEDGKTCTNCGSAIINKHE